jgi:hypothetical protein
MGRTLKRVPLDFAAPLNQVWEGYKNPHYKKCPDCKHGQTPAREWLGSVVHMLLMIGSASIDDRPLHPWLASWEMRPDGKPTPDAAELTKGLAGRGPDRPFGHDAIDRWTAEAAIIKAAGLKKSWGVCKTCKGDAIDPSVRTAYNRWRSKEPPKGKGFQLWETTSEGSPVSPVFPSLDALCAWAADNASTFGSHKATAAEWKEMLDGGLVSHREGNMVFL